MWTQIECWLYKHSTLSQNSSNSTVVYIFKLTYTRWNLLLKKTYKRIIKEMTIKKMLLIRKHTWQSLKSTRKVETRSWRKHKSFDGSHFCMQPQYKQPLRNTGKYQTHDYSMVCTVIKVVVLQYIKNNVESYHVTISNQSNFFLFSILRVTQSFSVIHKHFFICVNLWTQAT